MMLFLTTSNRVIFLMGLTCFCQALRGQDKTIKLRVPEGYDEITYDASQISRPELDHWLTLSPVLSQNTYYLIPEDPLVCPFDDRAYVACSHEPFQLNPNNAQRTQDRIRDRLKRLNTKEFPLEFEPIVLYFRAVQSFALWRNQREIDYFESKNVDALETGYEPLGLDPRVSCSGVLQQIRTASDALAAWHLVVFDWENCMWRESAKAIGEYPK